MLGLFAAIGAWLCLPAPARAQFTATGTNSLNYGGSPTNHVGNSYIGNYDIGAATLEGGATRNLEGTFILGYGETGDGTMNITGAGTVWTFAGTRKTAFIGYTGAGALNVNDSGRMNFAGNLSIGTYAASATTPATLTIASGGVVATTASITTSGITIGVFGGTNAPAISVSGAGSLLSVGGGIQFDANSSLTVTDGGQATFTKITLYGAAPTVTTSFIRVSGAGSLVSATGALSAGTDTTGIGNLTVADGGKLRVGGTFTMTRGTIKVGDGAAPGYLDTTSVTGINTGSPTIEFNHTSSNYSFTNDAGTGITLDNYMDVKVLAGTTVFTANNTYNRGTTITGGTLLVLNAPSSSTSSGVGSGPITIGAAGTLIFGNGGTSGTVSANGAVAIANDGQLTFNRSDAITWLGAFSGSGAITKQGAGELFLYANNAAYTGTLTVSGGTLTLWNANALGSGATTIAPGTALKLSAGGTIPGPITLSGTGIDGNGALVGAVGATLSGPLTLAGDTTVNIPYPTTLTLTGAVGESATASGLTKIGPGTLVLAHANTYTGGTAISAGVVNVQHSGALGTGSGGVNVAANAALQIQGDTTLSGHGLTLNSYGFSNTGALRSISGNNTWDGNVTLASASRIQTESGSTLTITGGLGGADLDLAKSGTGTLVLGGAGTFLGTLSIDAGTLTLGHSLALQSAIVQPNGGTLSFGQLTAATFGGLTGTSPLALTNASSDGVTLTINATRNSTYLAALSGAGSLVKTGSGTLRLSAESTLTGPTVISAGTLEIGTPLALQSSPVVLTGTGRLTFGTSAATFGGLSGDGNIALGNQSLDLTVNTAATSSYNGVLSGSASLIKSGSGALTLTNAHTYTGPTVISGGRLVVDGSIAASSRTTVTAGGTLSGHGTVGALTIASGGTLAPGNSPGTLTAGDTSFAGGGKLVFEINDANGLAGTAYDRLAITGGLTLTATSANPFLLDLASLTLPDNDAGLLANFDPSSDYAFTFVTTTTGITGFDAGAFLIDSALFQNAFTGLWSVSLTHAGHDLALNYTAAGGNIPEPATYAAILGAAALAGVLWHRRRASGRKSRA